MYNKCDICGKDNRRKLYYIQYDIDTSRVFGGLSSSCLFGDEELAILRVCPTCRKLDGYDECLESFYHFFDHIRELQEECESQYRNIVKRWQKAAKNIKIHPQQLS